MCLHYEYSYYSENDRDYRESLFLYGIISITSYNITGK